jgi:hypothetical protein
VSIPDYLELDVIVTTQSSPLTFQFTAPNMSFLQTSFPTNTPNLFYDRISGNNTTNNAIVFTGAGGGYGHIRYRGTSENAMFFHDSNVTAMTGWFVGQSVSIFGAGNGSGFGIARTTSGNISNTNGLYMLPDGKIGINTTTPTCSLTIGGLTNLTPLGTNTYFGVGAGGLTTATSPGLNVSLQAPFFIVGGGFSANSDSRIKENIQDVQDDVALQRLRLIQPKTYTYKDFNTKGTDIVYGFIAQQVRSVLPYSTGLLKDCIPDIYQLGDRVDDIVTLRDSTFSFNESSGNVKFIQKNGAEKTIPVEYISSNQLRIKNLSELDETESEIFVYGREVEDFHTLNKDAIFTVNVAATQELDRQLQAAKVQIASLETRLALLESQFAASQTPQ